MVRVAHWQRRDNCDAFLADGACGWVLSGLVHKFHILENGDRRIVDVMMPGDFFGLPTHRDQFFSYEAVANETATAMITRPDFAALALERPALFRFVLESASQTIARLEMHILVQGSTTSTQKIGGYLLLLVRRLSGNRDIAVTLPISRYDIADHVGIAVETVSRAISELRHRGVIELEGRRCLSVRRSPQSVDAVPEVRHPNDRKAR
jgi:CRP-like cAMP-binding protein